MILTIFLAAIVGFVGIGLIASLQQKGTVEDYLLADRQVPPLLAGLSAMASMMSGFVFIGYVGLVYVLGIYATWFFIGQFAGYAMMTPWLQNRVRALSVKESAETFPELLSGPKTSRSKKLELSCALITLLLLGLYAAAQLTAGGKALNSALGWPVETGAMIGALVLLIYSFSGGIRASIWTDAAQAAVMIGSMAALCFAGLNVIGGLQALFERLHSIDPALVSMAPNGWRPAALFAGGWLANGLAAFAMPHVTVRFMTVADDASARKSQYYFLSAVAVMAILATLTALITRVMIVDLGDPELALMRLTSLVLPEVFVGLILAGVFASSMSTADSLVLSCSSAISRSLVSAWGKSPFMARISTLCVIGFVFVVSVWGPREVFAFVVLVVGAIASAFGPLLVVRVLNFQPGERLSLAMMISGLSVALVWRFYLDLQTQMFEAFPGIISGFLVFLIGSLLARSMREKSQELRS